MYFLVFDLSDSMIHAVQIWCVKIASSVLRDVAQIPNSPVERRTNQLDQPVDESFTHAIDAILCITSTIVSQAHVEYTFSLNEIKLDGSSWLLRFENAPISCVDWHV